MRKVLELLHGCSPAEHNKLSPSSQVAPAFPCLAHTHVGVVSWLWLVILPHRVSKHGLAPPPFSTSLLGHLVERPRHQLLGQDPLQGFSFLSFLFDMALKKLLI